MRVLLLAEECNPEWTSVALEGWNWATSIAREVDVTLVSHVRNQQAIQRATPGFPVVWIDNEWIAAPLYRIGVLLRGGRSLGYTTAIAVSYLAYLEFERRAWRRLGEEVRGGRYDLVHRVTPVSPVLPSPLARHCQSANVPFVVGPLNGGLAWSKSHPGLRQAEREWFYPLRAVARYLPFYRSTFGPGTYPVAGSRHTLGELKRMSPVCAYLAENGIDPARFHPPASLTMMPEGPLILSWMGRMVPYKAADLVLEALARLKDEMPYRLHLMGDGPQRQAWEALARRHGIAERVLFHGWVDQAQTAATLRESHVFCFPSLREFGGAVVAEAMACGAVPVVVGFGGPAEIVDRRSGVRVPMGSRDAIVDALVTALRNLNADRARLSRMRQAAAERGVRCFSWQNKARALHRLYESVLASHASGQEWKPDAFPPLDEMER